MVFTRGLLPALVCLVCGVSTAVAIPWNATKYMFVFGDSYTTDGYNISNGINSPDPGYTSSNGQNWVEYLTGTYNNTPISTYNLAYGGATIDSALVTPYLPTVLSVVNQVSLFEEYLACKPAEAPWESANSLFVTFIGINDVGNSWYWTNVTQPGFHQVLMNRLFGQMELLYTAGARNFLFLTVPPTNRAPQYMVSGPPTTTQVAYAIYDYNYWLNTYTNEFMMNHTDITMAGVFDTQVVFNTLLDNPTTFGFVNTTGYCGDYANGTPNRTTQVAGCAPVSSYFWLNTLHPLWTVHDILAKSISTYLSGYVGGPTPETF
ncbi:carbohydrate esterase family 16 protein [Jaapia argillacea MUCL 33604]|uniref:Carbohydrate esterase family 16 protein n=1 Tax=Jaapia argillacea MUCL 33604 TaxID=933084 RepID=A0A067Q2D0_9AGAM|nr:carbohydrate esterase family 16 protein [Jaapia argillacea MUCL 33604]